MDSLSLFLLALGLSLDDFTLAFAICLILPAPTRKNSCYRLKEASKMAGAFTMATALLCILGWVIGLAIYTWMFQLRSWVILFVFCGVGLWIIMETLTEEKERGMGKKITSFWILFMLGVLGSLDEGAVGISYAFLDVPFWMIIVWVIGVNTLLVFVAASLTFWISTLNQKVPSMLSGLILIYLGIANWIEIFF